MSKIHHVAIWVRELEKIRDFYNKYFEVVVGEKYTNEKKKYASYFIHFENTSIELMARPDIIEKTQLNEVFGWAHIAICLGSKEKVLETTEKLRTDGYQILGEPRTTGDGFFEVVIADPEGNKIELTV